MSQKAIREFDGKSILVRWLRGRNRASGAALPDQFVQVNPHTNLVDIPQQHPWVLETQLVVKPDQLIKRRGKAGLICLNCSWNEAFQWISERRGKTVKVERVSGKLDHFIIEPFVRHEPSEEFYVAIVSRRDGDEILFHHEGGIDVGDVDSKARRMMVPIDERPQKEAVLATLLPFVQPVERREPLASFITELFDAYAELHFAYLEINPLVVTERTNPSAGARFAVIPLDMAAKLDETARFEVGKHWGPAEFPAPFGRPVSPEEAQVHELDAKGGASLKLTVLNPEGRIWLMVAGGGASVVYADTITDLGFGHELANYGEYSGAPTTQQTYEYARIILELLTRRPPPPDAPGKILIIGGGIANFTDVAETFQGIIRALTEFSETLIHQRVRIFVRRGGPNYQEGLKLMRQLAAELGLPIVVHGPERHMTAVVSLALGKETPDGDQWESIGQGDESSAGDERLAGFGRRSRSPSPAPHHSDDHYQQEERKRSSKRTRAANGVARSSTASDEDGESAKENPWYSLFTTKTRAIVFGMQPGAVQNMLDFDYICKRTTPSVAAVVYPFTGNHYMKFYWQTKEVLIPIFQTLEEAMKRNLDVDVVVNFSSFRSVHETTMEILSYPQVRTIAIIAEGVPERRTRQLIKVASQRGVTIIGPATVGGIKPGCFRIGNTGGMLDNIIYSRLYRPGSVAYVARSGGMSNELNLCISVNSDGVYEGVAIGGDMYPGTTFVDHILRFQNDPNVKMIVVLGEVGGVEEYRICEAMKAGEITKPLVAWCIGTCAKVFPYEVQFGHAGACASGELQTADAKNKALKLAGAVVPDSFNQFGVAIAQTFQKLVSAGVVILKHELPPPQIPVDYAWARKLGLVRKPSNFVSSISDERGDELTYAGMNITDILEQGMGVGGVVGLLWFRRRLPDYFCRFIELVLMVTADHGPAVAGAHNTIVTARAGKDLISSLVSGLLTIGPRFGGALDGAAAKFSWAYDSGLSPEDFVETMRKRKELIQGIGHRVKSLENPDMRVTIVKKFVKDHFKGSEILDYALEVERVTTRKKSNLILNVDGAIGCAFVDLMRSCGAFTRDEADEYVRMGTLNGLFVLGRSIGLIGHFIDQNRLKQPLYRHPTDDISYITQDLMPIDQSPQ